MLNDSDPVFPDTVQGLVQAINFTISRHNPRLLFGWQVNLWASPPGGWTTSIPPKGIIHKTLTAGIDPGRNLVAREAAAIGAYYREAGITSYGAKFVALDKFGLDAAGVESRAAGNPGESVWFWNSDLWGNYLAFANSLSKSTGLPLILWQLPAGHINGTVAMVRKQRVPDLRNVPMQYEDSGPTYFFGDSFRANDRRLQWFGANASQDPGVTVNGDLVSWSSHMQQAASAGVKAILFGPGVRTGTRLSGKQRDHDWWLAKVQQYLQSPVQLSPQR